MVNVHHGPKLMGFKQATISAVRQSDCGRRFMNWVRYQPHVVGVCLALFLLAIQAEADTHKEWRFKGELRSFEGGLHSFSRIGFDNPEDIIFEPDGPGLLFQASSFPTVEADPGTHKLRSGADVLFTLKSWRSARAFAFAFAEYTDTITTTPPAGSTVSSGFLRFTWHLTGRLEHSPRQLPLDAGLRRARLAEAGLGMLYRLFDGTTGGKVSTNRLGAYHSVGDDDAQTAFIDFWRDDQLEGPMELLEDLESTPPTITVSKDVPLVVPWVAGQPLYLTYYLFTGANIRYDLVVGNPNDFSGVGTGAFFYNTATLRSLEVLDENFNRIAGPEAVHSANGYTYPVPEPTCIWQFISGLVLAWSMLGRGLLNIERGDQ
jgi:hypothetical protein